MAYSKHCFALLHDLAGIEFDHFVLDQGSQDGTPDWLRDEYAPTWIDIRETNIGISRGLNELLDQTRHHGVYDVIVKFDNDCELTTPDTLKAAVEIALTGEWIVSPHIQGLNEPPAVGWQTTVQGYRVGIPPLIGGIFMAAPGDLFEGYRHDENNPIWGMDDVNLCSHWRYNGGEIGYLLDYPANHYETTQGQRARYPDYFVRKDREFAG